jgi:hypothetical protein
MIWHERTAIFTYEGTRVQQIHAHTFTHTHTHTHIYTRVYTATNATKTQTYIYIYIYIHTHTDTHICTCTHPPPQTQFSSHWPFQSVVSSIWEATPSHPPEKDKSNQNFCIKRFYSSYTLEANQWH